MSCITFLTIEMLLTKKEYLCDHSYTFVMPQFLWQTQSHNHTHTPWHTHRHTLTYCLALKWIESLHLVIGTNYPL